MIMPFSPIFYEMNGFIPGGGVLHYPIRQGCALVFGGVFHQNSGNGVYLLKRNSGIGSNISLKFWACPSSG